MKPFSISLLFAILALTSAQNGYRYQPPQLAPSLLPPSHVHQHHHNHQTQGAASHSGGGGIFSPIQSPPLQSFHPPQAPAAPVAPEIPLAPPPPPSPPQNSYLPPVAPQSQQNFGGGSSLGGSGYSGGFGGGSSGSFGGGNSLGGSSGGFGSANSFSSGGSGGFGGGSSFGSGSSSSFGGGFQSRPQTAIITKDIYIHSAPEETEEAILGGNLVDSGPIRKNYRIVFIKAPSHNYRLNPAALKAAQSANEEKTVIYVLSKKPDLNAVTQQLQQAQVQQKSHKPEVYFIKYKTQEEAQRAQQEIQAQYDALGGSTHISDEGIAPVTSVSGSGGSGLSLGGGISQQHSSSSYSQQNIQSGGNFEVPSRSYLPIIKKK